MKFDAYALKARIAPAFFTIIIPVMVFNHFYASEEFSKFVGGFIGAKLISNMTISGICLFFLSELGRILGKHVFEKIYFKDELYMPTTELLLFNNNVYSEQHKMKIRKKIKSDFKVELSTKEVESADEMLARTKIVEIMALVRKKLHGNKFLLQHNIEYGALRNAIGGAIVGSVLSISNILFFGLFVPNVLAKNTSIVTLIVYLMMIIFSKITIEFYGNNYAKILYREYLG
jgi:hypothetical protein